MCTCFLNIMGCWVAEGSSDRAQCGVAGIPFASFLWRRSSVGRGLVIGLHGCCGHVVSESVTIIIVVFEVRMV